MTISLGIALMKCMLRVVFVMYNNDNNGIYGFTTPNKSVYLIKYIKGGLFCKKKIIKSIYDNDN